MESHRLEACRRLSGSNYYLSHHFSAVAFSHYSRNMTLHKATVNIERNHLVFIKVIAQ